MPGSFNRSRLRELRTAKGWSPTKLAARVGVTEAAVRKWELGLAEPGFRLGMALAAALGVRPEELLTPTSTVRESLDNGGVRQ